MNILIAPDKFKGSMTANEVCQIIKETLIEHQFDGKIYTLPMADGGEGSLDCFITSTKTTLVHTKILNCDFQEIDSCFALKDDIAFIELAKSACLALTAWKNPGKTTTYGVGQQIQKAIELGAKKIYLAVGGSATNDAGCGMAAALGVKFYNRSGKLFIPTGDTLNEIGHIEPISFDGIEFTLLCDVTNPLYGKKGAAYMYASQKGASLEQVQFLDENLKYFAKIAQKNKLDLQKIPGSGAAGGIGGGAVFFLNAKIVLGAKMMCELFNIEKYIQDVDLIITGEGKIDAQSRYQKLVYTIYEYCKNKKMIAFCGCNQSMENPFDVIEINQKNETLAQSLKNSKHNLKQAVVKYFFNESRQMH